MTTQPLDRIQLVAAAADILSESADEHGTHDHLSQASDILAWLDRTGRLVRRIATVEVATVADDQLRPLLAATYELLDNADKALDELNSLRLLLGLQDGERHLCGATADGPEWGSWTAAERVCLRPAGHTYPSGHPSRHRGLCGSWTA